MTKRTSILFVAIAALILSGCVTASREVLYPNAPTLLPGVEPAMNTAGFWIGLNSAPDEPILDSAGIDRFNKTLVAQKLVRDLSTMEAMSGAELKKEFAGTIAWIGSSKIYRPNGKKVSKGFIAPLVKTMNGDAIPENIDPRYGFVIRQADMRVLPTNEGLFDSPGDTFIDNLQASSLEPGTPLVILHQSANGEWLYAYTDLISGWIRAEHVAVADANSFRARYRNPATLIVTASKADFYEDAALTKYIGSARMGTKLAVRGSAVSDTTAIASNATGVRSIMLADRDDNGLFREKIAWVESAKVSDRVLPYTTRTIYRQVFALLNAPYGWGGTFGEQDCSQFLCEIFATVGIALPRNSSRQARVGTPVPGFAAGDEDVQKTLELTSSALPGATILRLPGHIMLYLGTVNGKIYAIHSTWGYTEIRGGKEITRLINRVTVSTLELGRDTKNGTHLHRITDARIVNDQKN